MLPRFTVAEKQDELKFLATLFKPHATLFEVGGAVRDEMLGIESFDIDVCAQLKVENVKKILSTSDFVVSDKNLRMGTVHISHGDFLCEYTTFRTDSYDSTSGEHTPKDVRFTSDMNLDARRRDFKCNAFYKDILTGEIVDLLGGKEDIENKIISTADTPQIVFEADGLRVLRMVRFASELGFEVEKETFEVAKRNAWRVEDIAVERIADELKKNLCGRQEASLALSCGRTRQRNKDARFARTRRFAFARTCFAQRIAATEALSPLRRIRTLAQSVRVRAAEIEICRAYS